MALTYNKRTRNLAIRGTIVLTDGSSVDLDVNNVISYSITESSGSEGIPLGTTESASYSLTISNIGLKYTPNQFDDARVHVNIGIETNGKVEYSSFGVWRVCNVSAPEQSVSIDLEGYDELATRFEATYTDAAANYPSSHLDLARTVCGAAGVLLKTTNFRNWNAQIEAMPEWGTDVTLRDIIGYIAACAGGFARIDRAGNLELVSYASGTKHQIDADLYTSLVRTNGIKFTFNALEVKQVIVVEENEEVSAEEVAEDTAAEEPVGDVYKRFAINESIVDNPTNTIQVEGNPLFTDAIAYDVSQALRGVTATAADVSWVGDPAVQVGDRLVVTDTKGEQLELLINSQTLAFSGGLAATTQCELPTINTVNSSSYTSTGNVIDSNGNINVKRITDLDKTIVSATIGSFDDLTAQNIRTDKLTATIINAIKLYSDTITAKEVETDNLTATVANILYGTINSLNAGYIKANRLSAAMADFVKGSFEELDAEIANILKAHLRDADIDWAKIEHLDAQVADLVVAKIGEASITEAQIEALTASIAQILHAQVETGQFSFAEVQNFLGAAMQIRALNAGQITADNLVVTNANLMNATISKLVMPGTDGRYYEVSVSSNGQMRTKEVQVSQMEIEAGQTVSGKAISTTSINAGVINAQSITANQAILDEILTEALTAGKITAMDAMLATATVPTLYVTAMKAIGDAIDISANRQIRLTVEKMQENEQKSSRAFRAAQQPEGSAGVKTGDLWVTPATGETRQSEAAEDIVWYVDEAGSLVYATADESAQFQTEGDTLLADADGPMINLSDDGHVSGAYKWALVRDENFAQEIQKTVIDQTDEKIALLAEQTTVDALSGDVTKNQSSIEQTARAINTLVKQTVLGIADNQVTVLESGMQQLPDGISSIVKNTKITVDEEGNEVSVSQIGSHINQKAASIEASVGEIAGGKAQEAYDSAMTELNSYADDAELTTRQLRERQNAIGAKLDELGSTAVLDSEGLHVHKAVPNPIAEVLVKDSAVQVRTNKQANTEITSTYIKVDGCNIARVTSKGIIFGG